MVAREGFRYAALLQQRHTKYGRTRGMVVGEGGRSTGVLLYSFATRLVSNAASINMWPRTALEMALPVNIMSYSIASEHYVNVLLQS